MKSKKRISKVERAFRAGFDSGFALSDQLTDGFAKDAVLCGLSLKNARELESELRLKIKQTEDEVSFWRTLWATGVLIFLVLALTGHIV